MAITLLTSSPGEVGIDEIRTKVNEVLQTLSLSTSPLASSPGQISIDTARTKINELIAEANASGGSTSTSSTTPTTPTTPTYRSSITISEVNQASPTIQISYSDFESGDYLWWKPSNALDQGTWRQLTDGLAAGSGTITKDLRYPDGGLRYYQIRATPSNSSSTVVGLSNRIQIDTIGIDPVLPEGTLTVADFASGSPYTNYSFVGNSGKRILQIFDLARLIFDDEIRYEIRGRARIIEVNSSGNQTYYHTSFNNYNDPLVYISPDDGDGWWAIDRSGNISGSIDGTAFTINKPVNGWKYAPGSYTSNNSNDSTTLNWRSSSIISSSSTTMYPGWSI